MSERTPCMNKTDAHAHAFVTDFNDPALAPLPSPAVLKSVYAEAGVTHSLLLPLTEPVERTFFCPTEHVMAICEADPGFFSFAIGLDPRMLNNSPESDFGPLLEYYISKGAVSAGEIQANIPIDSPLFDNLFSQLEQFRLPVTLHFSSAVGRGYGVADPPGLPGLERALKKFPELIFIGHSQAFWAHISAGACEADMNCYAKGKVTPGRVWELLCEYPNLYCDLSAGSGYNALTRDEEMGLEFLDRYSGRLMFGCDMGFTTEIPPVATWLDGQYMSGNIGEREYMDICRDTAKKVFGIG